MSYILVRQLLSFGFTLILLIVFWNYLQETSPSVVFIKDLELGKTAKSSPNEDTLAEDEDAKVEGTGSGFIWDKFGHIVSNFPFVF